MVQSLLKQIKSQLQFVTDLLPANVLLKNNVKISNTELEKALAETAIEREWYEAVRPFSQTSEITAAVHSGSLVKVDADANATPIMRFRNSELHEKYPPYVTKESNDLLKDITAEWRRRAEKKGVSSDIRLALTSFVRTEEYQEAIIRAGKIAQPNSPHLRGEAFDIDASGYYAGEVAINARRNEHVDYHKAFEKLGAAMPSRQYGDYSLYEPVVHAILEGVLRDFQELGRLHYLPEYIGTTYACFHVCRNPHWSV